MKKIDRPVTLFFVVLMFMFWACFGIKMANADNSVFSPDLFSKLAEKIMPAVVEINNNLGTGVLISPDGYILTNRHIYDRAYPFKVRLYDGREFKGKLVNKSFVSNRNDPDVALVKIDGKNFPYLPLGDSDKLKIGEFVAVVGNFADLSFSFSVGLINSLSRKMPGVKRKEVVEFYGNYIQHSAVSNTGSSGGPLVNLKGELIGINSLLIVNLRYPLWQGITFAIPINDVVEFLNLSAFKK